MVEKKYLLSDDKDYLVIYLEDIGNFHATKKLSKDNSSNDEKYILPLDCLMNLPFISTYDCEDLMKKYPDGIVTENLILIPHTYIELIGKYEQKEQYALVNEMLSKNMIAFVENILNIEFTDDEKARLSNQNFKEVENHYKEPEKSTNKKLLKLLSGKNYSVEEKLEKFISIESDVKESLENNKENFQSFPTLLDKLSNIEKSQINTEITLEEFGKIVESAKYREISPTIPLKIVMSKLDKEIKKYNNDMKEFSENFSEELREFISSLNLLQYKLILETINKKFNEQFNKPSEEKNNLVTKMYGSPKMTEAAREILIDVFSSYDKFKENVRFKMK